MIIILTLDKNGWIGASFLDNKQVEVEFWSYSGHKDHIMHLMQKVDEYKIVLTDEQKILIKKIQDSFIYPPEEEIEAEKRKQFEIQFRYDRDSLLKKVDIAINKAEDLGQDTKDLRAYRQALRGSTKDWIMPKEIF